MKNYHRLFLIPCSLILCLAILAGFSPSSAAEDEPLEYLLERRTKIIQNAIYGNISKNEAEIMLREVETVPLLKKDIKSLYQWDSTRMDIVKKGRIIEKTETAQIYDYISYRILVRWEMAGAQGDYSQTQEYHMVIKKMGMEYRMSDFTPID
ncbi:MAG: hypothetical protein ACOX4U_07840 [Anaerovoracaceae bacterium]|jgi:hypothetical protein